MKKGILGIIAGVTLPAAGLLAQDGGFLTVGAGRGGRSAPMVEQFQQAGTMTAMGPDGPLVNGALIKGDISGQTVTGRPVSGTEERKSTQTLGDGTEIATSESDLFYRDSAGRTRRETTSQGRTVIVDPVARVTITLNAANKIARKTSMADPKLASAVPDLVVFPRAAYTMTIGNGITTVTTGAEVDASATAGRGGRGNSENMQHEELGVQSLNGILATGTRNTLTIPQGQIGNNRDIHVVNERWYSDDLQMLVKTVNSDPRFGENTYQFINVSRDEPDASLFQIPPEYTVLNTSAGRGVQTSPASVINK